MLTDYLFHLTGIPYTTSPYLLAGMPSVSLTDVVRMRLETISFFGLGILVSAGLICWLWNGLRRDFEKLPQLSYRAALFGTILWGLLFILVLTMISGARELLTPGAWEKNGLTFQLRSEPKRPPGESAAAAAGAHGVTLEDRQRRLEDLRSVLLLHASRHDGRFPDQLSDTETFGITATHPGFPLAEYGYVPGRTARDVHSVLAFEYDLYSDGMQLALMTDGSIKELSKYSREQLSIDLQRQSAVPAEIEE